MALGYRFASYRRTKVKIVETIRAHLSRRVGPSFADMAIAADAAYGYPDGWGTSPRRAPSPAKAYKPAHGGYPGTPVLRNPQPFC